MRNKGKLIQWIAFLSLLVVIIFLVVTTYNSKKSAAHALQNVAVAVAEPAVEGTYNVSGGIKDFFQRLFALRQVDKEYEELKSRVLQLELENQQLENLKLENERLTELLGFTEDNPEYKYINAKVIAKDPGSWFMEFTINRGEKDGIEEDMAVANQDGLIGRIIEVNETTSQVITIIDTRSAAAGVVERSRDQGIVRGASDPESITPICHLDLLPNDADLIPGDLVLSSSLGGIYPKGIIVGEVEEVVYESGAVAYAKITPSVDFRRIEEVLIITEETSAEELAEIQKENENEAAAEAEAEVQESVENSEKTSGENNSDQTQNQGGN
jgi:rod shape-determining protein MreC